MTPRWSESPSVSVGAWQERPMLNVGLKQDRDYVQNTPMSRSTQDLSTTGREPHQKIPANPLLMPRPFVRQQELPPRQQSEETPLWKEMQARRNEMGMNPVSEVQPDGINQTNMPSYPHQVSS